MKLFGRSRRWWGIGLGAGLAGAAAVVLRHALGSAGRSRIPESISPAIFATRVARTAHGQILYHESGSGQPVIFLHGAHPGSSSYEWSKVYPDFAAQWHVLAPDLIGFGESERPGQPLGPFEHARALVEFIGQTCANRPSVLVGSHYGAALAILLASQNPDLVQRLILFAPSGLAERIGRRPRWKAGIAARLPVARTLVYRVVSNRRAIRRWMEHEGFSAGAALDEAVEVYSTCAQQYRAEVAGIALLARNRLAFDFEKRLRELPIPVAMLWPARSTIAPLQTAYRLVGSAPQGSTLDVLPDCGILAPLERPEAVASSIRSSLDSSLRAIA